MSSHKDHRGNIDVAHLSPTPFALQAAFSFLERGDLGRFHTTLAFAENSFTARMLRNRRVAEHVPPGKLYRAPFREILRLAAGRVKRDPVFTDRIFHWMRDGFEDSVIRRGFAGCSAVYGYETQCLRIFQAARQQGVNCVLDVPSPEHDYVESILESERGRFSELRSPFDEYAKALRVKRTEERLKEALLADLVVANSQFTANSWIHAGVDANKVAVVPYGAPELPGPASPYTGSGPFQFLFAGTFDVRKGGHYLLEAWEKCGFGDHAELHVYGSVGLPSSLTGSLPRNVVLHGPRPHSEVLAACSKAGMMVFPTLCDGFGMVVLEAFSQGLPVLTTSRAGAADFVRNGENGWLLETMTADALAERMQYSAQHPDEIAAMRPAALQTARTRTWAVYRQELRDVVQKKLASQT